MSRFCWLLIFSLLLIISPTLAAFPSVFPTPIVNGPSGVVRIPSADVVPYKNFNLAANYGKLLTTSNSLTGDAVVYYNMNLGTFHGVELGIVGGTERGTNNLREGVFVNMKLSLSTGEEPNPLLLALGVENLFSHTQTDVYMVATKYLAQGPKLTFGFQADFPNQKFRPLGILGGEFAISNNLILATDLMAGETLFQLNGGARFYFSPIFSVNFSALNILDGTVVKDARSALLGFSWANPF
jgi:hypothetical protein